MDAGSTLVISGQMNGVANVSYGGISKYGAGTLVLSNSTNTFASGMYLAGGTVQFVAGSLPVPSIYWGTRPGACIADFEAYATLQWASGNTQDVSGYNWNNWNNEGIYN